MRTSPDEQRAPSIVPSLTNRRSLSRYATRSTKGRRRSIFANRCFTTCRRWQKRGVAVLRFPASAEERIALYVEAAELHDRHATLAFECGDFVTAERARARADWAWERAAHGRRLIGRKQPSNPRTAGNR